MEKGAPGIKEQERSKIGNWRERLGLMGSSLEMELCFGRIF